MDLTDYSERMQKVLKDTKAKSLIDFGIKCRKKY